MSRGLAMVLILVFMIGGGIGLAVGALRGRPVVGFVLGCLLMWIGWIIVATLPPRSEPHASDSPIHPRTQIRRWVAIGLVSAFVVGGAVGLVVGLAAHPSTAWFALFEIGIPAASLGALVGLAGGTLSYALGRHRGATRSTLAPSPHDL